MNNLNNLTKSIARTHMYWGRKPIGDLVQIFKNVKNRDIVLDPFCGGGNPALAALLKKSRVIAGDLNPMAVFLTKVLLRPINISSLKNDFESVANAAARDILNRYKITCPECKESATIKYVVWAGKYSEVSKPISAQIECRYCGKINRKLTIAESKKQIALSKKAPRYWYPKTAIHSSRKPPVSHYYELFTQRNLSMLAELLHAIQQVKSQNSRDALLYVFTAMLYSCSEMQMYSEKEPSSSRGWQALRFYVPPKRKEMNVWSVFEGRFRSFVSCKEVLNRILPSVRISHTMKEFVEKGYEVFLAESDAFGFIKKYGAMANSVFIDPPYIDDIDYFGFSEFWGAWMKMKYDYQKEWHPINNKSILLKKLLGMLSTVTQETCEICLAFAPKSQAGWDEELCIKESKYHIKSTGFFNYDNSNKRGVPSDKSNRYTILGKSTSSKLRAGKMNNAEEMPFQPYLQIAEYIHPRDDRSLERVHVKKNVYDGTRSLAIQLAPEELSTALANVSDENIKKIISNSKKNMNTYHALCLALLKIIITEDQWTITYIDSTKIDLNIFGLNDLKESAVKRKSAHRGVAFVAEKNKKQILFCFDDLASTSLKSLANNIIKIDSDRFDSIGVMIVHDMASMQNRRKIINSRKWPRGFFLCFEELREKAEKVNIVGYQNLCANTQASARPPRAKIRSLRAQVSDNIPIGVEQGVHSKMSGVIPIEEESAVPSHFKLRFKTPKSFNIVPGQFVMVDTTSSKYIAETKALKWEELKDRFSVRPTSYLKRPFGIHRAFYPNFGRTYLQRMKLPATLATILHTVFPNEFEIFYKVQPNGIGTHELTKFIQDDEFQLIGPLGNGLSMRDIRNDGVEEIHVIGGGVGMAPLIFMVQALQYYSYNVKVFIGIEKFESLKYSDGLGPSFAEEPKAATIYIDDLSEIGIDSNNIHISTSSIEKIGHKIPEENQHQGLVTDRYRRYLEEKWSHKKTVAFACGPMGMMETLTQITEKYGVQLKVLMEKRMACGIGVCLSCVCKTKSGEGNYSRVCTDGPIFNASEILW